MKDQENSTVFKDASKINPDGNESSDNCTNPKRDAMLEALGWKDNKPVDVATWFQINEPKIYPRNRVEHVKNKISFVCDILCKLLFSWDERSSNPPMIINSVNTLPIFEINLKKYDVDVLLYWQYGEWDISVKSSKPLDCDFMGVFNPKETASAYVFHADRAYPSYELTILPYPREHFSTKNHAKFTARLRSDYHLYTFFFILKHYLDSENGK